MGNNMPPQVLDVTCLFDFLNMVIFKYVGFLSLQVQLKGYTFAVFTTYVCPRNKTEWLARSLALKCTTEGYQYMCIPNESITILLEFCYKSKSTLVQPG